MRTLFELVKIETDPIGFKFSFECHPTSECFFSSTPVNDEVVLVEGKLELIIKNRKVADTLRIGKLYEVGVIHRRMLGEEECKVDHPHLAGQVEVGICS